MQNGDQYGDNSCALGYCCSTRCFNAAHMSQLGWAPQPTDAELSSSSLPVGATITVTLQPQLSALGSVAVVHMDWPPLNSGMQQQPPLWASSRPSVSSSPQGPGMFDYLYLGYRTASPPYDADVDPGFWGGVNVVGFNTSVQGSGRVGWSAPTW